MRRDTEAVKASAQRKFDEEHMDGKWLVVTLVPGFIEAHTARQFGAPCLVGTRLPAYVGRGWVWEGLDNEHARRTEGTTQLEIVALAAFDAGVEWQRKRARRKRVDAAVTAGWAQKDEAR